MDATSERIVLVGAGGSVGRELVTRLVDLSYRVRVFSRRGSTGSSEPFPQLAAYQRSRCELVECDDDDGHTLEPHHFEGAQIAYYLRCSPRGSVTPELALESHAKRFGIAAKRAGVKRVILLRPALEAPLAAPPVAEILRALGLATLDLRADLVIANSSMPFRILRDASLRLPCIPKTAWLDSILRPIALDDVCVALSSALETSLTGCYGLDGPEAVSLQQLLELCAETRGRRSPEIALSWLTPQRVQRLFQILTSVPADRGAPWLQLLSQGRRATTESAWPRLGLLPQVPVMAAILQAVASTRRIRRPRAVAAWAVEDVILPLADSLRRPGRSREGRSGARSENK